MEARQWEQAIERVRACARWAAYVDDGRLPSLLSAYAAVLVNTPEAVTWVRFELGRLATVTTSRLAEEIVRDAHGAVDGLLIA